MAIEKTHRAGWAIGCVINSFLSPFIIYCVWNGIIADITHLRPIGYWEAFFLRWFVLSFAKSTQYVRLLVWSDE